MRSEMPLGKRIKAHLHVQENSTAVAFPRAPAAAVDPPRRPIAAGFGQGALAMRMRAQVEAVRLRRHIRAPDGDVMDFVLVVELCAGTDDESVHRRWISLNDAESEPNSWRLSWPRGRVRSIGKIPSR